MDLERDAPAHGRCVDHAQIHTRLPARSASVQLDGARDSSTIRPRAALAGSRELDVTRKTAVAVLPRLRFSAQTYFDELRINRFSSSLKNFTALLKKMSRFCSAVRKLADSMPAIAIPTASGHII